MNDVRKEPQVSRMAIAALVCGILTMTCVGSPFFFLPALFTGHLAWNLIGRSKGMLVGKWMALWGMVCGWGFVVLGLVALFYLLAPPYRTVDAKQLGDYKGRTVLLEQQHIAGDRSERAWRYRLVTIGPGGKRSILHEETSGSRDAAPSAVLEDGEVNWSTAEGDLLLLRVEP
jgi:hypothetical protein